MDVRVKVFERYSRVYIFDCEIVSKLFNFVVIFFDLLNGKKNSICGILLK